MDDEQLKGYGHAAGPVGGEMKPWRSVIYLMAE
jgi:hypothetical protein